MLIHELTTPNDDLWVRFPSIWENGSVLFVCLVDRKTIDSTQEV